ncbi:hypothetical protein B9T25_12865 [Acinetobacter sp. ANC 4470]|uniref:transposase n=1 Tax=Acinetobacter sp. ANC 4470 TaxID=1977881 RepID=UPI000A331814|nr:transposase [Acinetobacter sp. ANC 4470]OTG64965.1 hypothetical protein B9T25_12865 [Acinetobacter sp. ANC 4470]
MDSLDLLKIKYPIIYLDESGFKSHEHRPLVSSIIVMDNATFHKRWDTQELLKSYSHQVLWLPPYRPDLNSIENMSAWVKRKRKEWLVGFIDLLFQMFFHVCMKN